MSETPPNDGPNEQLDDQADERDPLPPDAEEGPDEKLDVAGMLADVAANQSATTFVPDPVATEMAVALMHNGPELEPHMATIYQYLLHRVANVAVAEDLSQQTIETMIRSIRNHRARRTPTGEFDMLAFKNWYLGIARNYALLHFRRERVHGEATGFTHEQLAAFSEQVTTIEEELARSESLTGVILEDWATRAEVTPDQYEVLWMYDVAGFSIEDIARELKIAEGNVRARIWRGHTRLAKWLAKNGYADWVDKARKRSRKYRKGNPQFNS